MRVERVIRDMCYRTRMGDKVSVSWMWLKKKKEKEMRFSFVSRKMHTRVGLVSWGQR